MILGARQGSMSGLRRVVAAAMARELGTFIIPGPEIARAHGLDVEAAGLHLLASPRHASVLLVVGALSPALREAATVVYAQMMRPRALFVLGSEDLSPLPPADVAAELAQQGLIRGVQQLRTLFAEGAFRADVSDFNAPALQTRIEYTCPMHPEVVQDEPGFCPECGMFLVPRDALPDTAHEQEQGHSGMAHRKAGHGGMDHSGMDHSGMDHSSMDHSSMDHGDMAFMSMVGVTKDLPRSTDGLPMEWIEVPFGPFFPGLPGGLLLTLTLDGDTVAAAGARSVIDNTDVLQHLPLGASELVKRLADMDPLAPVAYRLLTCQAIENAAQADLRPATARARIGALERERLSSHLGWLALFGEQTGFAWLQRNAAALQLKCRQADRQQILALRPDIQALIKRLQRTPLLKSRTAGIGRLTQETGLYGPVARASGVDNDARGMDEIYAALSFVAIRRSGGDALARLQVHLDELSQSLVLIEEAGEIETPVLAALDEVSGEGTAVIETARGMAELQLTLESGQVRALQLTTPSTSHLQLIGPLSEQQALADALLAVASLDLSPWEVRS